jgi:hypothetical protein
MCSRTGKSGREPNDDYLAESIQAQIHACEYLSRTETVLTAEERSNIEEADFCPGNWNQRFSCPNSTMPSIESQEEIQVIASSALEANNLFARGLMHKANTFATCFLAIQTLEYP